MDKAHDPNLSDAERLVGMIDWQEVERLYRQAYLRGDGRDFCSCMQGIFDDNLSKAAIRGRSEQTEPTKKGATHEVGLISL